LCDALTVFIFGVIGILMIGWGLYALAWDAWKAKRATSRVTICIAGIVAIGIGYLFTNVGFS
jgi:cation transport ATPase